MLPLLLPSQQLSRLLQKLVLSRQPTPRVIWFDDDGKQAGIVHQERNWTYVLVEGAGHLIAYNSPERVRTPDTHTSVSL